MAAARRRAGRDERRDIMVEEYTCCWLYFIEVYCIVLVLEFESNDVEVRSSGSLHVPNLGSKLFQGLVGRRFHLELYF